MINHSDDVKITRREFGKRLGQLGVGAGALGLAGCGSHAQDNGTSEKPGQMKLRKLGRTGLVLSPLGFGAQHTRDSDLIRYALDQGVNLIETAWSYGFGRPGNSCQCIGKAIAGKRDSVCLAVAFQAEPKTTSKIWVANQFDQTLRDLGTDHIDIFLWHHPGGGSINNSQLTLKESQALVAEGQRVELMLKWKSEGKLRWCGITTHSEQPKWLQFVADSKLYDVAVVAFNYKSSSRIIKAMEEASRKGTGLICMKTQSPDYFEGEAKIGGAPDHRQALNWVLSKHYITAAIPGMTARPQVALNLQTLASTA
jgi:aryl-alcohol dehydrogenase-like predicted oxidoreductase